MPCIQPTEGSCTYKQVAWGSGGGESRVTGALGGEERGNLESLAPLGDRRGESGVIGTLGGVERGKSGVTGTLGGVERGNLESLIPLGEWRGGIWSHWYP